MHIALSCLDGGRIGIGAQSVGIARAAFADAASYAADRIAFGGPIARLESVQHKLARMRAEIDYLLLDPDTQPENPDWLVEKPLLMPESWVAFGELDPEPITSKTPFERNGRLTFGTMNNPYKYTRESIAAWAEIMRGVPDSRFLVVRPECGSMAFCTNAKTEEFGTFGRFYESLFRSFVTP